MKCYKYCYLHKYVPYLAQGAQSGTEVVYIVILCYMVLATSFIRLIS